MGLFDRLKKKVADVVQSATEAVKFDRLKEGLSKTSSSFVNRLSTLLTGRKIDASLLMELEEILITSDIGLITTEHLINHVRREVKQSGDDNAEQVYSFLKEGIAELLVASPSAENDANFTTDSAKKPHVIIMVGVNGVGKTTTIGKLAHNYKSAGKSVLIGACDTFRAAANEQLEVWAERAGVGIVQQATGADPAAVAFDTLKSAIAKDIDVVIIDTAGRLHNKLNLMQELEKIGRVMKKVKDSAPDEVFLVLDGTTGQNALQQAKEFTKSIPITGIVLSKLDGTAKGGAVIAIASELKMPVRYIGVGEKIDDLQVFEPITFVEALFQSKEQATVTQE